MNPTIVLLPTTIEGEPFHRLCFFLGFGACNEMVAVEDSGLLIGKSNKVSIMAKNRGHKYTYPAQRAIFAFDGGRL
jgi:hypothetical protein